MKSTLVRLLAGGAAVALCLGASAMAAEIKIGIVGPMSGQFASDGQDWLNAVTLAFSKVNAKGGAAGNTITTVTGDDACDPQQGVAAASKLVSAGVVAIVGGYCSGAVLPTLKIYGDAGIPFVIVAANSTKLVAADPGNAFLINSTGDMQALTVIDLLKKKGFKSVAIVDEGDAYSSDLAKLTAAEFEKGGGKVVAKETTASGEQDYSSLVSRIKAAKADAVFWTAYYGGGALLTKQLRQAGYQGAIVLGDGNNSPEYLQIAGSAAERVYMMSAPVLEFLPEAKSFIQEYRQAAGRDPGAYGAMAYDGASLIADAITRAKSSDAKAVIAALKSSDFHGLAGEIKFTDKNTLIGSNFTILQVGDGKWALAK
jgi:branched-chain amino acid transport system substrate-binding protein